MLPNMLSRCSQFVHTTFPNKLQRKGIVVVLWNLINLHRLKYKNWEILLQLFEGRKKKMKEKKNIENFPFHFPYYQLVVSSSDICSSGTPCTSLPVKYWAICRRCMCRVPCSRIFFTGKVYSSASRSERTERLVRAKRKNHTLPSRRMRWATVPSTCISQSWIHLKHLSYPLLSNIPTWQKHLNLWAQGATQHSYASLIPVLQSAVHDPPQPVLSSSTAEAETCQPVPPPSSLQPEFVSQQPSTTRANETEKVEGKRVVLGLVGIPVKPCPAIPILATQPSVTPGRIIIEQDPKPTKILVVSYCQTS